MLMLSCESSNLRVLVVDDHDLTRLTLKLTFSCQENIQVVGLASNGQEAIEMVKDCHPDVIILDLQMPVMDGWSASSQIKAISPHTQILAYSSVEDVNSPDRKTTPLFDDVCKKDVPTDELVALVRKLGKRAGDSSISQ
ncbi:response regulator containing a CheY-like receiver domain and an HTH DNA-binding domain [Nostoc sp. PCC 7524]|uniref:response regulator n=1 Tax=Nostoc sp. (strain ATCC 29411 / PCC 7524) TaxID=28072 RepID=UPI00029F0073|nr:response regulator transcription factor [Nostoc sp. PCC 7524]AFY49874.1 response regulator containing a CheY-like receiver domain and an HTH DNA-binding domain [Nostoc sp. PCC 7524]